MRYSFFIALLFTQLGSTGPGQDPDDEGNTDPVALAALLIGDGHYERAASVLERVDANNPKIDRPRYLTLRGLIDLSRREYSEALEHLKAAQKLGQNDPALFLYRAQAHVGLGHFDKGLDVLSQNEGLLLTMSGYWLLRGQCLWRRDRKHEAWDAFAEGGRRFPENPNFGAQQVQLLVDLGLYREAAEVGRAQLARKDTTARDYAALSEAFVRNGQWNEAATLMEEARLRFGRDEAVLSQLARAYLKGGKILSAAMVLEEGAARDAKLSGDAAELYRRGGAKQRALYLNMQEPDQKRKLRQRIGLLVDMDRFEEAVALAPRLRRLALLEDQDVAYALAYSLYRTGAFIRAERHLKRLTKPELYQNAIAIREAMANCGENPWACE